MYRSPGRHWSEPTHRLLADGVFMDRLALPSNIINSSFTLLPAFLLLRILRLKVPLKTLQTDVHMKSHNAFLLFIYLNPLSAVSHWRAFMCLMFVHSPAARPVSPQPLKTWSAPPPPLSPPPAFRPALMTGRTITGAIMTSNGGSIQ